MVRAASLGRFAIALDIVSMTSPCGFREFEQIVDGADHRPLGSDLVETAQEELPEASGMFDLTEDRFDDLLSEAVAAAPAGALEFCRHGGLARSFGPSSRAGGIRLAVARPAGGQVADDPTAGEVGEVLLVTVAGVGRDFLGIGAQHRTDFFDQRHERAGICRARLQALGDDDLMRTVDGDLGVVAGDHRTRARRLDAAVGIGELRWARSGGPPSGPRCGLPLFIMPEDGPGPSSFCGGGFLASASSVALATRMRSIRAVLLATQSGISSPRRSEPWVRSSSASVASARENQADTSAVSLFSVSSMRP